MAHRSVRLHMYYVVQRLDLEAESDGRLRHACFLLTLLPFPSRGKSSMRISAATLGAGMGPLCGARSEFTCLAE